MFVFCCLCSGETKGGVPRFEGYELYLERLANAHKEPMRRFRDGKGYTAFMILMTMRVFLSKLVTLKDAQVVPLAIIERGTDHVSIFVGSIVML